MELLRFEDQSGARFTFGVAQGHVIDFLPSFAADATTRLAQVQKANDDVVVAQVIDADGEQLTSVALELEQRQLLGDLPLASVAAAVVFMGRRVSIHADVDAFGDSPESLLDRNADRSEPPPSNYVARGLKWPLRVSSESVFSYGAFGEPAQAEAVGRFAGVVLSADRRTNQLTHRTFIVARVRTIGIDASVCLSGTEFETVPLPGQVIAGEAFIVGSIPDLEAAQRRRWWRRGAG